MVGSTVPVTKLTKGFLSCFQKDVGTHFKERRKYLKLQIFKGQCFKKNEGIVFLPLTFNREN